MEEENTFWQNFWHILPLVFATKSSKEIVYYYYSVFMLRKRYAQNISSSMDVDKILEMLKMQGMWIIVNQLLLPPMFSL